MAVEYELATSRHGPSLTDKDVHVWQASLNQPREVVQQLACTLAADEQVRATHFHFEHDRKSFIIARGILRLLLSRYLDLEPIQIELSYEPSGKPQLSQNSMRNLFFNLSHSHDMVLYVLGRNRKVGIDLEYMRPINELEQIADQNFSAHENAQLKTLTRLKKLEGFFNCWTRKEAYIKAVGAGLSYPLQQFDVSLIPGEPARLLNIADNHQEASQWSLKELKPAAGYIAALAVEGHEWQLSHWQWTPNNIQ